MSVLSWQLSAISYQLSAISYQFSVISYQFSVIRDDASVFGSHCNDDWQRRFGWQGKKETANWLTV
jgi:hypothetical protein